MQTESEIVRVESMTLRVWRARLDSIVFGKDSERQVTALFSTDSEAKALLERLVRFGEGQSVIAAPRAAEDQRRLGQIGQSSQALAAAVGASDGAAVSLPPLNPERIAAPVVAARFFSACGAKAAADARFCAACGGALAA